MFQARVQNEEIISHTRPYHSSPCVQNKTTGRRTDKGWYVDITTCDNPERRKGRQPKRSTDSVRCSDQTRQQMEQ